MTALAGSVAQAAAEAVPADGVFGLAWLLVALPLVGAAVLLLVGRRGDRWGHWLGVAAPAASFLVALVLWITMLGLPADERVKGLGLGTWIRAGSFSVDAGLRIDPLSMTFVLLVTFVGTLIHVYSVAYMAHDADRVHVDQGADEGDQEDEGHRQRVDPQAGIDTEGTGPDPGPESQVLDPLARRLAEHGDPEHEGDQERRAGCGNAEPVAPAVTAPSDQQQHRGPDQRQRDEQPGDSEDAVGGDGLGKCSHHPLLSSSRG